MNNTEEQEKIISSNEKYIFVSAIAGSGKTLTLIKKYISNYDEKDVIISFTNVVKNEILSRLKKDFS